MIDRKNVGLQCWPTQHPGAVTRDLYIFLCFIWKIFPSWPYWDGSEYEGGGKNGEWCLGRDFMGGDSWLSGRANTPSPPPNEPWSSMPTSFPYYHPSHSSFHCLSNRVRCVLLCLLGLLSCVCVCVCSLQVILMWSIVWPGGVVASWSTLDPAITTLQNGKVGMEHVSSTSVVFDIAIASHYKSSHTYMA